MAKRKHNVHFRVNPEEEELIRRKMEDAGISSVAAYMRKMAIEGYVVRLDLSDVKEAIRLLRISGNNLNQYAKKANETGSIYAEDIKDVKARQEELWKVLKQILDKLSEV
jgi:hypothetical protein